MKQELFRFLKKYTTNEETINQLIVSSFLSSKKITDVKNKHINSLIIKEHDENFAELELFNSKFSINTLEKVIEAFEYVISPEDKVISGAIYTPAKIRGFILDNIFSDIKDIENKTVCDPACGCSGFLFTTIQKIKMLTSRSYKDIIEENIFGLDIKSYAIERSKILLTLLTIENGEEHEVINFNFIEGNALSNNWHKSIENFKGFDVVIGNPPYVCSRNIDLESKKLLSNWKVSSSGHPDLYIPFFEIGLSLLKNNGYLGFITMNTFFKSLNGRVLRAYFSENKYSFKILDFGDLQVFDSRSTYTCICLLRKTPSNELSYKKVKDISKLSTKNMKKITYDKLDDYNGWNFQSHKIITQIENTGSPFYKVFKTSNGIATLKNSVFIIDILNEDDIYYHLTCNSKVEKLVCVDIVNSNKFIKKDNLEIEKKKIIFPYEYNSTSRFPTPISEISFKKTYPEAYKYLKKNKGSLAQRDKGNGNYAEWFAYGRSQGLEKTKFKLLFPHISPVTPKFVLTSESILVNNGMALIADSKSEILLAKKIMQSKLFWFYIMNTSKPYGSNYLSLSRNYIKSFGIFNFSEQQKQYIIEENDQGKIDSLLEELYEVNI